MTTQHRYCVIMCGGIGSRLWPYSRATRPKPFIDFFGTGRSLLQMTYDRILPQVPKENIIVVTNSAYADLVREHLPELQPHQILCEPARRNTAPSVAWAAYHISALDAEAAMVVVPADNIITRENIFIESIARGFDFVEHHDVLLNLGITPTFPATGYGYLQIGEEAEPGFYRVKTFTEKPNKELAQVFVDSGEFFWNSGIFIWKARTVLAALHEFAPDLTLVFDRGLADYGTAREQAFINTALPGCPALSIDHSVMEKAQNVYTEVANFGWNDLGTWRSLYDVSPKNRDRNVAQNCKVMAYNAEGNIIAVPGNKLVVVRDLNDFIIADVDNVLLICPKSHEQQLRNMVNDARITYGNDFL